ncbi:hypothetical protein [Labedella endophytica]|uniref:Uncharacterized protein n=1 Tax=Labedella endophytica TaxID=1523160 RepID=A0A3S0VBU3_9MICO|nr:hypothetical protein [Labedella endophytica]RUR01827.1 hypothetical protein ELQ94_10275 [Labedella endophytica]
MKLYSDVASQRTRQIIADVLGVLVLVVGIVVAVTVRNGIAAFDAIGRDVQTSGEGLASTMSEVGENLSSTPLIGEGISAPFDAASGAATTLAEAGENWQLGVHTLAAIAGWTIAAIAISILVFAWIRPRIVGAVRRGAVARLTRMPGALELLAFRALVEQSPRDLLDVDPAVVERWRGGDPAVTRQLAALELRAAGIRLPG